ncbi:hypothetical protein [Sphingobacterium siyangense]|uniref:hypothetical protein n=1 Tax=Sphingobacterium siyangense TaxID=459529 RepID=UPI002FDDF2C9
MNKRRVAILLEFGFHEIKKYIHSGFIDTLKLEFDIIWIALNKNSIDFDDYFKKTGYPIIYVEEKEIYSAPSLLEKLNSVVRKNWLISRDFGSFHNHVRIQKRSFKTKVLGNWILKNLLEKITLIEVKRRYNNKYIESIFNEFEIDQIFTTGVSSSFAKYTIIEAQKKQIPVNYLINSWKDLYINNFVPFKDLASLFVWSNRMKIDYLAHMPYLNHEQIIVSGNPTFDVLVDSSPINDREYYANKYGLDLNSKWILYTMMPPRLTQDEIDTILYTAQEINKSFSESKFSIIIKRNPEHSAFDFKDTKFPKNVILADHFCFFDKKNDMIVQSKDGENEWLDLLRYSVLNLSVPSTVTLEFLTLGKPVFNIAYNSQGNIDTRIEQFFNAGFYHPLFNDHRVQKIESSDMLINKLRELNSFVSLDEPKRKNAGQVIVDHILKIQL